MVNRSRFNWIVTDRMDLYKNRISFFVLCLGITFFSSCTDGDNNDDWKLDLPELSVDSVSMLGVIGMHGAVMFSINDVPYIGLGDIPLVGKNRCFFYYSDEKRSWESIGEYPGGAREGAVAFVIGNKAYVGLGITITIDKENGPSSVRHDDFFVYDSETGTWDTRPVKFPGGPRAGTVAFSIEGKGYVGAGEGEKLLEYFADFYEFDPETGWKQISGIARARVRATAFVANGYGYVCFGVEADDIQKFDPKSNTWKGQPICYEKGENAEIPSNIVSFVLNKDGRDFVYVNGGWGYDPQKNIWKKVDYPIFGEYGFTMGGRGYSMGMGEKGGFVAKVFEVIE